MIPQAVGLDDEQDIGTAQLVGERAPVRRSADIVTRNLNNSRRNIVGTDSLPIAERDAIYVFRVISARQN